MSDRWYLRSRFHCLAIPHTECIPTYPGSQHRRNPRRYVMVTGPTTGFGDLYPTTDLGKVFGTGKLEVSIQETHLNDTI